MLIAYPIYCLMKRKNIIISVVAAILVVLSAVLGTIYYQGRNRIVSIVLTSPNNTAMYSRVAVQLAKPAPIYVEYEEVATGKHFRTRVSASAIRHQLDLLLLKANTEYRFRVVIDKLFKQKSASESFTTAKQASWLVNHWLGDSRPHDASALGDGMVLVCNARLPGYIMMIDGQGEVRWYWQIEGIGVRSAILTPRGTILAMLRPFSRDVRDSTTHVSGNVADEEHKKPTRRGPIGFVGGTQLCEISLTGKLLWRLDLKKVERDKQFQVIHHDFYMDKQGLIHALYRPDTVVTVRKNGVAVRDTLNGDGVMVIDSLGKVHKTWSAWTRWDMKNDPYMAEYGHDRFHMNGLIEASDGNYLLSVAIEDQIWKVNKETGEIMWKFGKKGDFKMSPHDYFSFQHTPNITKDGELLLFDNGLYTKRSAVRGFKIDEKNKTAKTSISILLPGEFYSSRMGSAYLLPNDNLLISCAKTGAILVTNRKGDILWQSMLYFAPYRAVYVPQSAWKSYFVPLN